MGSASSYAVCPQCGAAMHHECWYNSGSSSYTCSICGFDASKMIHYEMRLARDDKAIDVDGYYRNVTPGHGIVSTRKHPFFNRKETDNATIPLDEDDEFYYETWVENGRLKKIKVTQEGLSYLMAGMHIILFNGETYLAADEYCRLRSDSAKGVYSDVTLSEGILNKAREYEPVLYLHGVDAFLNGIDSALGRNTYANIAMYSPYGSLVGDKYTDDDIAKAREEFMAKYKEVHGEDFDFEKYISHKVDCPKYGFDNNICIGRGLKVEIDMSDVHEYWGIKSEISGIIECHPTRSKAFSQIITMLNDFQRLEMDYSFINDYSIICFKDGVETETAAFKFIEYKDDKDSDS